jgi:hypothetical protein
VPSGWGADSVISDALPQYIERYGVVFSVPKEALFSELYETHWSILTIDKTGRTEVFTIDHANITPRTSAFVCVPREKAILELKVVKVQGRQFPVLDLVQ